MRQIKIFFLSIFTLLIIISCKKNNKQLFNETIIIDIKSELVKNASEIFKDVKFIQLKTDDNNFIGEITSLKTFENILVIFDEMQETLFLFDMNGNLLNTIKNIGRGPGEYLSISDHNIIDNHLYILTNRANIDKYTLQGEFVERIGTSNNFIDQFQIDNDKYVTLSKLDDAEKRIFIFDNEMNFLDKQLPYKDKNVPLFNFWPELAMTKNKNKIYFYLPEYYGIYNFSDNNIIPKYKYNFKGLSVNLEKLSSNDINSKTLPVIRGTFINNNHLITQFTYENIIYQHIYSLVSQKAKLYNVFEINNDINSLPILWSVFYGSSENYLYSVIPYDLFEDIENDIIFTEENDNPVIGVFTIKQL
ncbi:MAG: 6-bladed beta-propeller [Bacteroidales bacterium]|nr:6-bladed beta-propeller [Bacteroidales bacterium]